MSKSDCDHLWVAGGLYSDWICEHCGERDDIKEATDENDHNPAPESGQV
jgi:hypothetical protein